MASPRPELRSRCSSPTRATAPAAAPKVARWIRAALESDAELAVRIVDAEEGRALNRDFRGRDYATNVLTFDYAKAPVVHADLVLCAPVVEREAAEQGETIAAHYAHLLVHGTLHAQGWDHERARRQADGGARDGDPRGARLRRSLRGSLSRARAQQQHTEAIAASISTMAAKSRQCSCSFSHQAPDSAAQHRDQHHRQRRGHRRQRAPGRTTGCAKPKISTALKTMPPTARRRRGASAHAPAAAASTVITSVVSVVIQNTMASSGAPPSWCGAAAACPAPRPPRTAACRRPPRACRRHAAELVPQQQRRRRSPPPPRRPAARRERAGRTAPCPDGAENTGMV